MNIDSINFRIVCAINAYIMVWILLAGHGLWWLGILIPVLAIVGYFIFALFVFAEANKAYYPDDLGDTEI